MTPGRGRPPPASPGRRSRRGTSPGRRRRRSSRAPGRRAGAGGPADRPRARAPPARRRARPGRPRRRSPVGAPRAGREPFPGGLPVAATRRGQPEGDHPQPGLDGRARPPSEAVDDPTIRPVPVPERVAGARRLGGHRRTERPAETGGLGGHDPLVGLGERLAASPAAREDRHDRRLSDHPTLQDAEGVGDRHGLAQARDAVVDAAVGGQDAALDPERQGLDVGGPHVACLAQRRLGKVHGGPAGRLRPCASPPPAPRAAPRAGGSRPPSRPRSRGAARGPRRIGPQPARGPSAGGRGAPPPGRRRRPRGSAHGPRAGPPSRHRRRAVRRARRGPAGRSRPACPRQACRAG